MVDQQVNVSKAVQFLPRTVIVLGVVLWLLLSVVACWGEIAQNQYPPAVLLFGIGLTSAAMAIVSAWCMFLVALVVNAIIPVRRRRFKLDLIYGTLSLAVLTAIGLWSVFYLDS